MKSQKANAILRKAVVLAAGFGLSAAVGAAEDPYVEFTGTQCVDTGYFVSGQTAVVADFQMTDTTTAQQLVWSAGTKMWSRLYVNGEGDWAWSCQNWQAGDGKDAAYDNTTTHKKVDGDRVVATVDGSQNLVKLEKGGVLWYQYPDSWSKLPHTETSSCSLKIGCRFADNKFYASMRLYSFRIYEAGELVRDYVPAEQDGIVGLYDKKNGGFVYDSRLPLGGSHLLGSGGTLKKLKSAYIESNANGAPADMGSCGINARIKATADSRVEVDFAYTDLTTQQRLFGASSRPSFFIDSSSKFAFTVGDGGATAQSALAADTDRHTAVFDNVAGRIEIRTGETVSWFQESISPLETSVDRYPYALFANMHTGLDKDDQGFKFRHQAKVRIYGARFYRAGRLVYDYRPCVKGGVAGLKDALSGEFVCGEDSAAFTAGGDVERIGDDPYVMLAGNNDNAGSVKWINTGYFPGPTTRIVLDYALADNYPGSGEWFLMCAYTSQSGGKAAERLNFEANKDSAVQWRCGTSTTWTSVSDKLGAATNQRNIRRQLDFNAADGTCTLSTAGFTNTTATSATKLTRTMSSYAIRLGGNTDATPIHYAPLKIYGLKVYESGELVRDFVPTVQDGVVGLKDSKTGLFSIDATPSPKYALDAGGTISADENSKGAYVEFTGAQTIDTDFKPTGDTCVICDFQLTNTKDNPQQFVWSSNEMGHRIYTTGGNWAWIYNNSTDGAKYTNKPIGLNRLTATIDALNAHVSFVTNGVAFFEQTEDKSKLRQDAVCTSTMKIGSRFAKNESSGTWNFTSMKLYRFTVYEKGDKVRDYVPCVTNGVVGLYDLVNGSFKTDTQGTAPLKVGGLGSFVVAPEDASIASGEEATFDCLASGAVGYQWYVNGEAVEGATGATFTVPWRKGRPNEDEISVVPTYDVFSVPTQGEAKSATVTYRPNGLCILLR